MTTAAYLRVSTGQQSIDQQHDAMAAAGITADRVFTDTASGRAGSNRPGWSECMGYLRQGDHLVVVAVDRLGRSVREVATALHELTSRGVHVRSLREGVDTSTPTGRAVTSIMATIAELELELGKERRAASREARIARGLAATKPMKLDAAQQKRLLRLYQQGEPVSELTTMFGISRSTLFPDIEGAETARSGMRLSQLGTPSTCQQPMIGRQQPVSGRPDQPPAVHAMDSLPQVGLSRSSR